MEYNILKKKEFIFIGGILILALAMWGGMSLINKGSHGSIRITVDGKEYGTYSVEGNIMTLINGEDKQYYKVGENTLIALNQDKQAITGELADHYILHKK